MIRQLVLTAIQTAIRKAEEKKQIQNAQQTQAVLQQLLANAEPRPYRGTNIGFGCSLRK